MPVRQVLCGQVIFRQVCMSALHIEPNSIGQALQVNARFGRLMAEERLLSGRSVRSVAKRAKVKRALLMKWESGKASPPARKFVAIMRVYGKKALFRAAELDFQIQIEKYELIAKKIVESTQETKLAPATSQSLAA